MVATMLPAAATLACVAEQQQQAVLDKPIDLFKAIFEDKDSSEEEDSDGKPPDNSLSTVGPVAAPAAPLSPASQPQLAVSLRQHSPADQQILSQPSAAQQQMEPSNAAKQQHSALVPQQGRSGPHAAAVAGAAGRESDSDSESDVNGSKANKQHKHKRDSKHKHRKSKHTKKHKSEKHKGNRVKQAALKLTGRFQLTTKPPARWL